MPAAPAEKDGDDEFKTAEELWDTVLDSDDPQCKAWYQGATDYWKVYLHHMGWFWCAKCHMQTQAATVDGMLGGWLTTCCQLILSLAGPATAE